MCAKILSFANTMSQIKAFWGGRNWRYHSGEEWSWSYCLQLTQGYQLLSVLMSVFFPSFFLGSGTHPSHRLFMLTANQTQPFFLASLVFSLFSSYLSDAQFLCNDEDGKCVAGQSRVLGNSAHSISHN